MRRQKVKKINNLNTEYVNKSGLTPNYFNTTQLHEKNVRTKLKQLSN